jgi:hypothetical protein
MANSQIWSSIWRKNKVRPKTLFGSCQRILGSYFSSPPKKTWTIIFLCVKKQVGVSCCSAEKVKSPNFFLAKWLALASGHMFNLCQGIIFGRLAIGT